MKPVTGTLQQQIRAVLHNCYLFDHVAFSQWLAGKDSSIQELAAECPPDRVYEYRATNAALPALCYVEGYTQAGVGVTLIPTGGSFVALPTHLRQLHASELLKRQ